MAGQELRITGLREKQRALERLGVDTQDMDQPFQRIAQDTVREAQSAVTVRSGALRADIHAASSKPNTWVVRAGDVVEYAGVENYGPQGNEFLTRPANSNESEKARQIEAELRTIIRKYDL